MGLLVNGSITTTDGFELTSVYICIERIEFRKETGMFLSGTPVSLYLNIQFNCYKSREDKIALKRPIQLSDMFSRLYSQNPSIFLDPYAIAYSEISKRLVSEGYSTSIILEAGQVDGSLYIYNSEGVSRVIA
jgi:hypothetical protein